MNTTNKLLSAVMICAGVFFSALAFAQDFPTRPIHIIAPEIGGNADVLARIIAQGLQTNSGWTVVVENKSTLVVPGDTVAKAAPDGYTILIDGASFWLAQFLVDNVPYDPIRDFAPITQIHQAPNLLLVNPSLPVNSVQELIAYAQARPGQLNYASVGLGSGTQLAADLFNSMANTKIMRVSYRGGGDALTGVLGGEAQVIFAPVGGYALAKSGKLKALAITSLHPSALFPGLPTVSDSGLPGYEQVSVTGVFAPAKTPAPVIMKLNQAIVKTLQTKDVKDKLAGLGSEVVGSTPEEFGALVRNDLTKSGALIKAVGAKVDHN